MKRNTLGALAEALIICTIAVLAVACRRSATATPTPTVMSTLTPEVGEPIHTGDAPSGLVAVDGDIIVVNNYDKTAVRVGQNGSMQPLATGPDEPRHPLYAFGSLWMVLPSFSGGSVSEESDGGTTTYGLTAVVRLDPATGAVQATLPASGTHLVATATDVWAVGPKGSGPSWLWKIDPSTNEVTDFPKVVPTPDQSGQVDLMVFDGKSLWVVSNCGQFPCPSDAPRVTRDRP